jgi:hypothetical protein
MQIKAGNMWDELGHADLILFTANSTVKDGILVMGGGAAREARKHFPRSDKVFGSILEQHNLVNGIFGLIFVDTDDTSVEMNDNYPVDHTVLGAFQTKAEVWNPSTLGLVEYSTHLLHGIAHNWDRIVLNMPGTGLGGLDVADVMPIIETLPDNVIIYTYKDEKIADNLQVADKIIKQLTKNPLLDDSE